MNSSHPVDAGDEDRSRLLAFFAVAFAWSWTCWLLVPAIKGQSALAAGVLSCLGGFGPGVAAVAVVGYAGGRVALSARSSGDSILISGLSIESPIPERTVKTMRQ